jgi:hypothetical protein
MSEERPMDDAMNELFKTAAKKVSQRYMTEQVLRKFEDLVTYGEEDWMPLVLVLRQLKADLG